MNALRWLLAIVMYRLQCGRLTGRLLRWLCRWPYWGGRRYDWTPIRCEECGWRGPERWCWHTYGDDGSGEDVTPIDECPHCGSEV